MVRWEWSFGSPKHTSAIPCNHFHKTINITKPRTKGAEELTPGGSLQEHNFSIFVKNAQYPIVAQKVVQPFVSRIANSHGWEQDVENMMLACRGN